MAAAFAGAASRRLPAFGALAADSAPRGVAAVLCPRSPRCVAWVAPVCAGPAAGWCLPPSLPRGARYASSSSGGGDPYKVLGVPTTASQADIKTAYRKQALKWHPDRQTDGNRKEAERQFSAVSSAYETLSDSNKRKMHDMGSSQGQPFGSGMGQGPHPGGMHQTVSQQEAEQMFKQMFGSGDLGDILKAFGNMGGAPGGGPAGALAPGDQVSVSGDSAAVVQAVRKAGIDRTNDRLRSRCLGKPGKVLKVDSKDGTAKVSVAGVGEAWFPVKVLQGKQRQAAGGPFNFGDAFAGFGAMGVGNMRAGPGGAGAGGNVRVTQQQVRKPDGTTVLRTTTSTVGADGKVMGTMTNEVPLR